MGLKNENHVKGKTFGEPHRCLTGHNHFVTDLGITGDNVHVISSSWDGTLRLWDMRYAKCIRKFVNPKEKEVETVTFSADNCKIFSGGHNKNLSLWNVKAQLKGNSTQDNDHRQWVTKARYSQSQKNEYFATVGRDGRLKFWSNLKCIASIQAHENYINALALSLNGQYIVTGGKDAEVKVWDYNDKSKPHAVYKTESEVNGLAFNLQYQLVAAATDKGVRVWDINAKSSSPLYSFELEPVRLAGDDKDKKKPNVRATAVTWSSNLRRLYVGGADGVIRVYNITLTSN